MNTEKKRELYFDVHFILKLCRKITNCDGLTCRKYMQYTLCKYELLKTKDSSLN